MMDSILVVDDSKVMREMIIACLRSVPDATFTHAASGLEAIEQLSLLKFQLALLDLNMPDIGGLGVLDFVRAHDTLRALPVIVITSMTDGASQAEALKAGATRYITKPFDINAIQLEVRELLGRRPARA